MNRLLDAFAKIIVSIVLVGMIITLISISLYFGMRGIPWCPVIVFAFLLFIASVEWLIYRGYGDE